MFFIYSVWRDNNGMVVDNDIVVEHVNYSLKYSDISKIEKENGGYRNPDPIEIKNGREETVAVINVDNACINAIKDRWTADDVKIKYNEEEDVYYADHDFNYPSKKVRLKINTEDSEWVTDDPNEITIEIPTQPQTNGELVKWNDESKVLRLNDLDENPLVKNADDEECNYATVINLDLSKYNQRPVNECSIKIDHDVIKYIQDNVATTSGKLEIPTNNSVIKGLVNYQIDNENLNYANSISIDLSDIAVGLKGDIKIRKSGNYKVGDFDNNKKDIEIEEIENENENGESGENQEGDRKIKKRDEVDKSYSLGNFVVDVQPEIQYIEPKLYTLPTIKSNGIYIIPPGYDGLSQIVVDFNAEGNNTAIPMTPLTEESSSLESAKTLNNETWVFAYFATKGKNYWKQLSGVYSSNNYPCVRLIDGGYNNNFYGVSLNNIFNKDIYIMVKARSSIFTVRLSPNESIYINNDQFETQGAILVDVDPWSSNIDDYNSSDQTIYVVYRQLYGNEFKAVYSSHPPVYTIVGDNNNVNLSQIPKIYIQTN